MNVTITEEDLQTATWIMGKPGEEDGIYITTSDIVVKYSRHVRGEREAKAIAFIRENCPRIPVPEVSGWWKGEKDIEHLAMSKMPGTMLSKTWDTMDSQQKENVLKDLGEILNDLRKLRAPPGALIGPLDGGPAGDARAWGMEYDGPFKTESEFNDWLISLIHPESMKFHSTFYYETIRNCLKSNHQLRFSHGDLGFHNILVQDGRITGVIDWEFAGWYPEYWEYVKMIQFERDPLIRCFGRECWKDEMGNQVFYDEEWVVDQMLDSQVKNGSRVIKRPR